jgi:uncharacterized protein YcgL (UPF0745 family)
MNCDIYKSSAKKGIYLFVETGKNVSETVPEKELKHFGDAVFFKTISFDESSPLIAANPAEVINNIKAKNYHLQGARVTTKVESVSETGAAIGGGILAASLGFGPLGAIVAALAGYALANASKSGNKNNDGGNDDADS